MLKRSRVSFLFCGAVFAGSAEWLGFESAQKLRTFAFQGKRILNKVELRLLGQLRQSASSIFLQSFEFRSLLSSRFHTMNLTRYLTSILMLLPIARVGAQEAAKLPPAVAALKQRYTKDADAVLKQLRGRYIDDLKSSLRSATTKGDFPTAQAINAELADAVARDAIIGKWRMAWGFGSGDLTFRFDGTVLDGNGVPDGYWTIQKDCVQIQYTDDHTDKLLLPIDPKGTKGHSSKGLGADITCTKVLR
jgi:hypothetical protein